MSELITLVTPTGTRQECITLLEKYIKRQTYFQDPSHTYEWIIVDDGSIETKLTMPEVQRYFRGPKIWKEGYNTQRLNMNVAIPEVKGDFCFIIEDDDYLSPEYIEKMMYLLHEYPAVGEGNAFYYNIMARCWRRWGNFSPHNTFSLCYASLCQTAIRKELLPCLDQALNSGETWPDIALWRIMTNKGLKPFLFCNQDLVVGIKGMPGRTGIGAGHHPDEGFQPDPGYKKLEEVIGVPDTEIYKTIASLQLAKGIIAKPALPDKVAAGQMIPRQTLIPGPAKPHPRQRITPVKRQLPVVAQSDRFKL